jgi:transposase InsO family protein
MLNAQSKNQRVNRWLDYLLAYDYTIEYKAGRIHHLPDALSRNVPEIENFDHINVLQTQSTTQKYDYNKIFDSQNVHSEQIKEPRWESIINFLNGEPVSKTPPRSSLDCFHLENNCLYYTTLYNTENFRSRLVLPKSLIDIALYLCHDDKSVAHAGFLKTLFKARKLFYWPNMVTDIKQYVTNCLLCQKRKPGLKNKSALGKFPQIVRPNNTLGCDLIGPMSTTENGNKYVLTMVDHFSRYVYLYPIPNKETETVTRAMIRHCITYGPPTYLISDLGSEFISALWKRVCENLSIRMNYTTAYRPRSNGLTENRNRYAVDHLYFLMNQDPHQWDEQLVYTAAAMNSAFCRPINETPFFVQHGRDYNFDYGKVLNNTVMPYAADTDYNTEMSLRLAKAFKSVAESDSFHKDQYASQYNKNLKIHKLTPGSLVLLKNETKENTMGRKFAPRFTGPYRILHFESLNKCIIKGVHFKINKHQLVHTDRLKPCHILRDAYPQYQDLIEEFKNSETADNQNTPVAETPKDKTTCPKHGYNLRDRK